MALRRIIKPIQLPRLNPTQVPRICPEVSAIPIDTPIEKPAVDSPFIPLPLSTPKPSSGSTSSIAQQIVTPGVSGCALFLNKYRGVASKRKEKYWLEFSPNKALYVGCY